MSTWNIAKCKPSSKASWDGPEQEARVAAEILQNNADIVCIQEAPVADWGALAGGYTSFGAKRTHCGFTIIFVRNALAGHALSLAFDGVPAVAATLDGVVFASVHLCPGKGGKNMRNEQMSGLLNSIGPTARVVIAGDMNARQVEDAGFEQLGLVDAWKAAGSDPHNRFTWDSYANEFHDDEYAFTFTSRYDRVYLRGMNCTNFVITANQPQENAYLSDHFGIHVHCT